MARRGQALSISAKKNFRRKLDSQFNGAIDVISNSSGKLLLIPGNLSVRDVVLENDNLSRELKIWKGNLTDANKIIDKASSQIREAIKAEMTASSWPIYPADISRSVHMPVHLHRFLVGLMTGNPDNENPTQRVTTLVESFGQDLIYAVTGGQHKPPKHVLLPYAVKTLTGNTELIKALNRFGYGMSYSQIEENETA